MFTQTVYFPSKDGLIITADNYSVKNPKGHILLCHRSHFNRGEYKETSLVFNELGYSCLAIDQRSGMKVLGTTNETYALAKQKGLATSYLAAKPDIEAAIDYLYMAAGSSPIILVGSSYSASISLIIATEQPQRIRAIIAFSPGEYLKEVNVAECIAGLKVPAFITSAKNEVEDTTKLVANIEPKFVTRYLPESDGAHGSRVLWNKTPCNQEYWRALTDFLITH
jgi:pimeloyl-ACP methyl ester carboxylesterase